MMTTLLLTGLIFLGVGAASSPASVEHTLQLQPKEGTRLQKDVRFQRSMRSTDFRAFMGGQPVPSEFLPDLTVDSEEAIEVRLIDTYGPLKDGRLQSFERDYSRLSGRGSWAAKIPEQTDLGDEWARESKMEGASVAFTWDEETESYARAMLEIDEEPELLSKLNAELELAWMLPGEAVEVGDRWTVDAAALDELFAPGGDLDLNVPKGDPSQKFHPVSLSGEFEISLGSIKQVEGAAIAVLTIEGKATEVESRKGDLREVPVASGTSTDTSTFTIELVGLLEWDLAGGHALNLSLDGAFDHVLRTDKDPDQEGAAYASEIDSTGTMEVRLEFIEAAE